MFIFRTARGGRMIRWCLTGVILGAACGAALAADDKQQRLQALQSRIGALQETLEETRGRKDHVSGQLESMERRIGELARSLRRLGEDEAERTLAVRRLQRERVDKEQAIEDQRGLLARHLRSAYITGRQQRLKLLLSQETPGVLSRMMGYYEYLSRDRARRIEDMGRRITELRQVEAAVQAERKELRRLKQQQLSDQQQLQAARAGHRRLVRELEGQLRQTGAALRATRRDAEALKGLISRLETQVLRREAERRKSIATRKGALNWPVKGRLAHRFGAQRASGGLAWDGVVINAPEGREVAAVHHGRIAFADWLRGFGLLIILEHGDGYMSLYGFNQTLLKETGEWVDEGEAIALVGTSGGRTQPSLYFGLRKGGKPRNPQHWCVSTRRGFGG